MSGTSYHLKTMPSLPPRDYEVIATRTEGNSYFVFAVLLGSDVTSLSWCRFHPKLYALDDYILLKK